jgi:hypothetical protein
MSSGCGRPECLALRREVDRLEAAVQEARTFVREALAEGSIECRCIIVDDSSTHSPGCPRERARALWR